MTGSYAVWDSAVFVLNWVEMRDGESG